MGPFVLRRVLLLIPILIGVSVLIFLIMHLLPGDPARLIAGEDASEEEIEMIRVKYGLDKPLVIQYLIFMENLFKGEVKSLRSDAPVFEELFPRYLNTIQLAFSSVLIASILGILFGVIAAIHRNSIVDNLVMAVSLFGVSMPIFWLGILLILFFSVYLGWFPSGGKEGIRSLVLPSLTIGLAIAAFIARMTRALMLDVLSQDYIRTAVAYGFPRKTVIYRYALKNVMIPIVTIIGLQFGYLMGGAVLTESVFGWPGIGRYVVEAIFARDYTVVQVGIMVISATFVVINLLVDLAYAFLDPRIRRG